MLNPATIYHSCVHRCVHVCWICIYVELRFWSLWIFIQIWWICLQKFPSGPNILPWRFCAVTKNEMFRASANVNIFTMVLCSHENDIFHGGLELSWWKCFFSRVLHTITNHFFAVLMSFSDHELNLFGSRLPRKLTRRLASLPQQNSILVTFDSWDHGSFSWRES